MDAPKADRELFVSAWVPANVMTGSRNHWDGSVPAVKSNEGTTVGRVQLHIHTGTPVYVSAMPSSQLYICGVNHLKQPPATFACRRRMLGRDCHETPMDRIFLAGPSYQLPLLLHLKLHLHAVLFEHSVIPILASGKLRRSNRSRRSAEGGRRSWLKFSPKYQTTGTRTHSPKPCSSRHVRRF